MADAMRWYVVHTYSGYENKVASNIEKAVENRKLHDLIGEVKVPTETVTEIKDNKKREVERKIFPGYVMVKMIMTDDSWYVVRNIRGVTGFVGPGSKPVPLTDEEVARLGVEEHRGQLCRGRFGPRAGRLPGGVCGCGQRDRRPERPGAGHRLHDGQGGPCGAGTGPDRTVGLKFLEDAGGIPAFRKPAASGLWEERQRPFRMEPLILEVL